jgi:hypothetical protein
MPPEGLLSFLGRETMPSIADLKLDKRNARKRGPRAEGMLVASLQEVGAARSIVIDETNRVLAGNGTVAAAAEAGIERVKVVDADGETIVAVRRSGLSEKQKARLALLDNRTAELAEWDAEMLASLAEDGVELDDLWSADELGAMLNQVPSCEPIGSDEQGRLDQKATVKCPECGHEFIPSRM